MDLLGSDTRRARTKLQPLAGGGGTARRGAAKGDGRFASDDLTGSGRCSAGPLGRSSWAAWREREEQWTRRAGTVSASSWAVFTEEHLLSERPIRAPAAGTFHGSRLPEAPQLR